VKVLFGFGWKLLVSELLDTLYQDLHSLVIGVRFDSEVLGFCNRGKQFPQFVVTAATSTVQSVMLPAMSRQQDDRKQLKALMRGTVSLTAFWIFPVMLGLAGVAKPLIYVVLTPKWLEAVPYMQIYCLSMAFLPIQSLAPDSNQFRVVKQSGSVTWWRVVPEPFAADDLIAVGTRTDVKPMEVHKYTVVLWLEGDDPDCNNDLVGGHLGLEMYMSMLEEAEPDDNSTGWKESWHDFWSGIFD
jgi:hypothetical protein